MIARLARIIAPVLFVGTLAACSQADPPEPKKAEDFAVVLAVAPQSDGELGSVSLPAAAVAELKRPDLGDVRIYDAKGRTLSIALGFDKTGQSSSLKSTDLPAIPIDQAGGKAPVPVAIAVKAGQTDVEVTTTDAAAAIDPEASVLIDTREVVLPVAGIELDATVPRGVPVTFSLAWSEDLKTWTPITDKVLLRPGNDPDLLGQPRIALPAVSLRNRYVRVSWAAGPEIAVKGATVFEAVERQPGRVDIDTQGATLSNPHEMRFAPQIVAPISAFKLEMTGPDGIVPIELYGRNSTAEPWGLLARATLKQGEGPVTLELSGATLAEYRIVADRRSAGLSQVPKVTIAVEPVTLLAAFNDQGPFNLAVGHRDAKPAYFSPADLGKPSDLLRAWRRPAEVQTAGDAPVIQLAPAAPEPALDPRKWALWAVLLLGTAILAFAAFKLLKGTAGQDAQDSNDTGAQSDAD